MTIVAFVALALLGAANLALSIILLRRITMPISAQQSLANAITFLNESADQMTTDVARTLIGKINAIQDFGRAQGAAAAAQQITDLQGQIATLQQQLADAAGDPELVKQLQAQIADLQAQLATAQADSAAKDQAMIAAAQNVTDVARQIYNQSGAFTAVLDAGATEEDPAGGVLDPPPGSAPA